MPLDFPPRPIAVGPRPTSQWFIELDGELARGSRQSKLREIMTLVDEAADVPVEIAPSQELLAVLESTAPIREDLNNGSYGNHFVAFTDGSCQPRDNSGPDGPGGWATIIFGPRGERWEMHGRIGDTSSNRAEVCGLLAALACVPEGVYLGVQSDSRYLVDHVRAGCRANDSHDLWCEVREMLVAKGVTLSAAWVPGHSGHSHNERADMLASGRNRRGRPRPALAFAR